MAKTLAIFPGTLIILLSLQNIFGQQYLNNAGPRNSAGGPQQPLLKTSSGLNQIAQNSGQNFNSPQQANLQQMNYQQQSNIQQAPRQDFTQQAGNLQPQLNLQQAGTQQPVNAITNSQLQQQQNQNVASNVFSALHNIRQPSPNQGSNIAIANPQQTSSCVSKQNIEQKSLQPQNQPSPTFTAPTPTNNKPQTVNQPSVSMSYPEYSQYLPTTAFQTVPSNNIPSQQKLQMFAPSPAQTSNTNSQIQGYSVQNPPLSNSVINQQSAAVQTPIVMVPGGQSYTSQSQPIVLTLQPPQMSLMQNLPIQSTGQNQPIIYAVQTQPSSTSNHNQQQIGSSQPQVPNQDPMDNQSLLYYILSQMQNPQGNNNPLASVLPALLNTKSEKSSSMKTLLPLIFNMLNEKKSGCVCPHCGCNNNDNQNAQEPIVNSGYSNQKKYSHQEPIEEFLSSITENVDTSIKSSNGIVNKNKTKDDEMITSAGISEEDEDEEDSEEDYEDE